MSLNIYNLVTIDNLMKDDPPQAREKIKVTLLTLLNTK
jgi:hypothetical protein